MASAKDILKQIKENDVEWVDLLACSAKMNLKTA